MSTKNYTTGSGAGTVAAGDDARFAQISQNTSDISALSTTVGGQSTSLAGKASKGANTDITSLSGLTTALSITQGGTGSTTQNFVDLTTPQTIAGAKTFSDAISIPAPTAAGHPTTKTYVDSAISAGAPIATASVKGLVQLTGDLAGTASSPALAATGVVAGNYGTAYSIPSFSVDSKGRLTSVTGFAPYALQNYSTSNTGASNQGQWTKVATTSIGAQFAESEVLLLFLAAGDADAQGSQAQVRWRVKQQLAFGNNPMVEISIITTTGSIVPANLTAVVTSTAGPTTADLYVNIGSQYRGYTFAAQINAGSTNPVYYSGQPFMTTLPTGVLQVVGKYDPVISASSSNVGGIQLAGDLGGTASAPTLASTTNVNTIIATNSTVSGKASKGANSDITSLSGLTTALSLTQGGTGATSAPAARTSLGLGGAAFLNVGTASGTVAAGDDARLATSATNAVNIAKLTLTPTASKTAGYAAVAQDLVMCNAVSGAFTVNLPAAPVDGTLIAIKKTDASANAVTITTSGSDTFSIGTTSAQLLLQGQAATVRYMTAGSMWVGVSDTMPLAATDARYLQQVIATATYAPIASPTFTGTVSGITKTMVGLSNVDNTADTAKPVSTAQAAADTLSQSTLAGTNTQTVASYTLVLTDAGKVIEMNNGSSNTVTVPTNASVAYPVSTIIEICQTGSGQTTIAAGAGVTLRSPDGLRSAAQYATISLRKRATDEWIVSGYTAP